MIYVNFQSGFGGRRGRRRASRVKKRDFQVEKTKMVSCKISCFLCFPLAEALPEPETHRNASYMLLSDDCVLMVVLPVGALALDLKVSDFTNFTRRA